MPLAFAAHFVIRQKSPALAAVSTLRGAVFAPELSAFMEVTVEHLGSVQFEIRARGHLLASDQPIEEGGFDEGMTPPEFLLAALASCAGFYASQYLRKHKLALEGTRVRVSCEKVKDPLPRMNNFVVDIHCPVELSENHCKGVREAVEHCLVHNTLLHPPQITLEIACPVAAKP